MSVSVLSIYFEKAFDSLKWSYLDQCLETYNFGPKFRGFVKTLYNMSATILNNGNMSNRFTIERGVRQGCPLSQYIFLLPADTSTQNSERWWSKRYHNSRQGNLTIAACGRHYFFVVYKNSILKLLAIFQICKTCSGLKINVEKTKSKLLRPGAHFTNAVFCKIRWLFPSNSGKSGVWIRSIQKCVSPTISTRESIEFTVKFDGLKFGHKKRPISQIWWKK